MLILFILFGVKKFYKCLGYGYNFAIYYMIELLNKDCINNWLINQEKFHKSHHANVGFLGGGLLIYAFAYMFKSKCCVCLGSGSGFAPRLMRQAQFDCGIKDESETILVDANLPEAGWGEPDYHNKNTFFTDNFDVKIIKDTTKNAVSKFHNKSIKYLHIDADHSYEFVRDDFISYSKYVPVHGIITLHDSMVDTGVPRLVSEIKAMKGFEVCNIQIGTGLAVVRKLP